MGPGGWLGMGLSRSSVKNWRTTVVVTLKIGTMGMLFEWAGGGDLVSADRRCWSGRSIDGVKSNTVYTLHRIGPSFQYLSPTTYYPFLTGSCLGEGSVSKINVAFR